MRAELALTLALVLGISSAAAQPIRPFITLDADAQLRSMAFWPGVEAKEAQLLAKLGPEMRNWIRAEARREVNVDWRSISYTAAESALNHMKRTTNLGDIVDTNKMALAFLIKVEVARLRVEELKIILAQLVRIDQVKAHIQGAVAGAPSAAAASTSVACPATISCAAIVPHPLSKAEFDVELERRKDDLDSLNEMSERERYRAELAHGIMGRSMEPLPYTLQKMTETNASITQALK